MVLLSKESQQLDGRYVKECDETIIQLLSAQMAAMEKAQIVAFCIEKKPTCTTIHTVGELTIRCFTMRWILGLSK